MTSPIITCPSCGADTPEARFCDQCGEPLLGAPDARRQLAGSEELAAAASDPGRCLLAARQVAESGKLGEFLRAQGSASPAFLDAYARAFLRLGQFRAAIALLGCKGGAAPRDREFRNILALAVRELEAPGLFRGAHIHRARLGAAVALGERGFSAEAMLLANEELVSAAAHDETEALQVARIFDAAGRTPEFLSRWAHGRDGPFYSAYARAFLTLERPTQALELLERKAAIQPADFPILARCRKTLGKLDGAPVPAGGGVAWAAALLEVEEERRALDALLGSGSMELGRDGFSLGLRLCARLGDRAAGERIYAALQAAFPPAQAPELHYQFALACEKWGGLAAAADAYRVLAQAGGYQDSAERLARIERLSREDTSRLSAAVSACTRAPSEPGAAAAPGELIAGRFQIRRPLGVGGMGVVVQAFDLTLPRLVAIKRMRPELAAEPGARERFIQEARTVAALSHPYLVAIHDVVAAGTDVHLVFEFIEGETLQDLLVSRGGLPPAWCARALACVSEGLAFAHERGVVHRDLKPSNVMVSRHGHVKVMDFGIAKVAAGPSPGPGADAYMMGTPLYMAPEQHQGRATAESDVFALGATAYELLAGTPPFTGPDFYAQKTRERYRLLPESVPATLRELVAACLKADPAQRPPMASVRTRLTGA